MSNGVAVVKEIWVYPVKACSGSSVASARVTDTGLELDRAFCIVDVTGINVAKNEAISQRKMPALATIVPRLSPDGETMTLNAPDMPPLDLATSSQAYESGDDIIVHCSGRSTTNSAQGGWHFGTIASKQSTAGSAWVNKYLNRELPDGKGMRVSGKRKLTTYALCRSVSRLNLEDFPPEFELLAKSKAVPEYAKRFKGNAKMFSDFAPLLLVSDASADDLARKCETSRYPTLSFRGNVVVGGPRLKAWDEESWRVIRIGDSDGGDDGVMFRKIKECPRCTVPCRDQSTGKYLFPTDKLRLWKVLKKAFPRKYADAEWGSWSGAFFGVYCGNGGRTGVVRVGDEVVVDERQPWDHHLRAAGLASSAQRVLQWASVGAVVAGVALVVAVGLKHLGMKGALTNY